MAAQTSLNLHQRLFAAVQTHLHANYVRCQGLNGGEQRIGVGAKDRRRHSNPYRPVII
jgi:beta-galactosidase beta subunit